MLFIFVSALANGDSFGWLLGPFDMFPSLCMCVRVYLNITFWHYKILKGYSISCLSPRISHFCKDPWFLLLENCIRNQKLGSRSAHCYWEVIVLYLR